MTSPSEPVESREQPRLVDGRIEFAIALAQQDDADPKRNGYTTLNARAVIQGLTELLEGRASIRNLETLRDVHRRTIDDLISEAQTAGATIDELRAERDDWHGRFKAEARLVIGTRGQLAAALAEVSRLREQGAELEAKYERLREQDLDALRTMSDLYREAVGVPPSKHQAARLEAMAQHVESAESDATRLREQGEAVRRYVAGIRRDTTFPDGVLPRDVKNYARAVAVQLEAIAGPLDAREGE